MQPRLMALQAISFKSAKLSVGNSVLSVLQTAAIASLFALTLIFVILLPPCRVTARISA
jgi:hypothetical protein